MYNNSNFINMFVLSSYISILTIIMTCPSSTFAQSWEWQNPLPNGHLLMSSSFVGSSNGWVVGAFGTILHTTNSGYSWINQTYNVSIQLNSVSFVDLRNGWAVGWYGNIIHTSNGGLSWINQTSNVSVNLIDVLFLDSLHGWTVGASGSILHTDNGGTTWSQQSSASTSTYESISFVNSNIGWICGSDGSILHTIDGGSTWTIQTSTTTNTLFSIKFIDVNNGWASGNYGTIIHTTNAGLTWIAQRSGYENSLTCVNFFDGNNGYAIGTLGMILHTSNGGSTWINQSYNLLSTFRTIDQLSTDTLLICGSGNVILRSVDQGASWVRINSSGNISYLTSIACTDSNNIWVAGEFGTILHSSNSGFAWINQESETVNDLYGITFFDTFTGWVAGQNGTIQHTTNGGLTWFCQNSGVTDELLAIANFGLNHVWAVGSNGTIVHTSDGGSTWSIQASGTTNQLKSVSFIDSLRGWAVGMPGSLGVPGVILRTINGGLSWVTISSSTSNYYYSIKFLDSLSGWSASYMPMQGRCIVSQTTDGGYGWSLRGSIQNYLNCITMSDNSHGWVVGANGTIMATSGTGWVAQTSGTTNKLLGVACSGRYAWAVGTDGTILRFHPQYQQPLTLESPNGGEHFTLGNYFIHWNAQSVTGNLRIQLNRNYPLSTWEDVGTVNASLNLFNWHVTSPLTTHARIRILSIETPSYGDTSNADFSIANNSLSLLHPLAGDTLINFSVDTIRWQFFGSTDNIRISINYNYPSGEWVPLQTLPSSRTYYLWTLNGPVSSNVRIRVLTDTSPSVGDTSNSNFSIVNPTLQLLYPYGGEILARSTTESIRWTYSGPPVSFQIAVNYTYPSQNWVSLQMISSAYRRHAWFIDGPNSTNVRVRLISNTNPAFGDTSDTDFSIQNPSIRITYPNGGEICSSSQVVIRWNHAFIADTCHIQLEYDRNFPSSGWTTISRPSVYPDSFVWQLPFLSSSTVRIRAFLLNNTSFCDTSDANFSIQYSGINEDGSELPHSFSLNDGFPNPFNSSIDFRVAVPQAALVVIKVYNHLGQEVATLTNERLEVGYYIFQWRPTYCSSGIYFVNMNSEHFSVVRKVSYIK